jgi:hypothetical protein
VAGGTTLSDLILTPLFMLGCTEALIRVIYENVLR